jgi:hypothetical protein
VEVDVAWRGGFSNAEVNALHAEAFETRVVSDDQWDWQRLVLGRARARVAAGRDGLDSGAASRRRRAGRRRRPPRRGRRRLRMAPRRLDDELRAFYIDACGFRPTAAGLMRLGE